MTFPRFLSQCAPVLVLQAAIVAAGKRLGGLLPQEADPFLAVGGLIALAALLIFKRKPGWNLALLSAVALAGGFLLSRTFPEPASWVAAAVLLASIGLSLGTAYALRLSFGWLDMLFGPLVVVYVVGWFGVMRPDVTFWAQAIWAAVGVLLFTVLGLSTAAAARTPPPPDTVVAVASDLFVVYFNLWIAGEVISRYVAVFLPAE